MATCFCELFDYSWQYEFHTHPPHPCHTSVFKAASACLPVMWWKPSSHVSLCSHSLMFSKLLIAHTSRNSDFLISSLGKPCTSCYSTSGTSFFCERTSIIEFMEDHVRHTSYKALNSVILSITLLCCCLHWWEYWGQCCRVFSWMQSLNYFPAVFG
jgi:hypothetical protein